MENESTEKFLPIGSVVLLKGGTKKAMITGFCSVAEEDKEKIYDYTGCIYPEGYLDFDQICLFDHEQIDKVYHLGYVDEEETEFKKELVKLSTKFETGEENVGTFFNDLDFEDNDEEEEEESLNPVIPDPLVIPKEENKIEADELEYL